MDVNKEVANVMDWEMSGYEKTINRARESVTEHWTTVCPTDLPGTPCADKPTADSRAAIF